MKDSILNEYRKKSKLWYPFCCITQQKKVKNSEIGGEKVDKNDEKKRSVVIITVFLLLLLLGLGYAALTTTLNITGRATVKKQTWDIKLQNPNVITGSVSAAVPTVSGTTATYTITLAKPGDFYEFKIDARNDGTIDAKIGEAPVISGLSTEMAKLIDYTVTYEDGTAIAKDDSLAAQSTKTLKVRVEYKKDFSTEDFNAITWTNDSDGDGTMDSNELTLTYSVSYVQA